MNSFGTTPSDPNRWRWRLGFLCALAACCWAPRASAQDDEYAEEESSFTVNAMMKMQGGLFVPLLSDGFKPHENTGYPKNQFGYDYDRPCDQVAGPNIGANGCYPTDHGKAPGMPSIARATLQIEAHWDFSDKFSLHSIVRGVRSAQLRADRYAQVPSPPDDPAQRQAYAQEWAWNNYYNEFDLREFYADFFPTHWLSFRVGRQQVAWGETGQFRLLDVVNPINSTWRFGALESFEDQRIPLWMLLTTLDVPAIEGSLELLWIPALDRKRDYTSPPLSMTGAWGIPYSNRPGTYRIRNKDFRYPGGDPEDMRGGARWKGVIGEHLSYSLVYMYTHMQTPVFSQVIQQPTSVPGIYSADVADAAVFTFPRQHIAGLSLEYTLDSPIGMTARFEGAVEPNRRYSQRSDTSGVITTPGVIDYASNKQTVVSYAFVLQRPTMIRWLNPTQNILLVAQFMHTAVPTLDELKDANAVEVVGYNDWRVQRHSYRVIFFATTNYWNGLFTPRITGAYLPNPYYKDSGFYSIDLGFRIGPHYRVNATITDFIGKNAYRDLGLFRDRDELHASLTVLF